MFCPNCGAQIPAAGALFCQACGKALAQASQPVVPVQPQVKVVYAHFVKRFAQALLAVFVLLLIIGIGATVKEARDEAKRMQDPAYAAAKRKKAEDNAKERAVMERLAQQRAAVEARTQKQRSGAEQALGAEVGFTGNEFLITNRDAFEWTNVEMAINYGILGSGFKLRVPRLGAGELMTVGAMEFAKSDGARFNPFSYKVDRIMIVAETAKGRLYFFGHFR